jgi:MFS family permease
MRLRFTYRFFTTKKFILSLMMFVFWAAFGISPFIVVFLREQKLDSVLIGTILSVNSFIGIFGQSVWGKVSDKIKSVKKVFLFCLAVSSVTYGILLTARTALAIGVVLAVDTFFRSGVASLLDIWFVQCTYGDEQVSYGSLRLWGSIGFALVVMFYGRIAEGTSVRIIFPFYFFFVLVTLTIGLFINYGGTNTARSPGIRRLNGGRLFSNAYYVVFVLFIFMITLPNNPSQTFLPELFEQVGGNMGQYGLMHSIKAFIEVPFFFFGKKLLDRFGSKKIVIAASLTYTLQHLLFAISRTPLQVIMTQMLLGPAYSLYLLGMLYYIHELAPEDLKASAQTLAGALGSGLSSIVGNFGGGLFIKYVGLRLMYGLGFVSNIFTISMFLLSFKIIRQLNGNIRVAKAKEEN